MRPGHHLPRRALLAGTAGLAALVACTPEEPAPSPSAKADAPVAPGASDGGGSTPDGSADADPVAAEPAASVSLMIGPAEVRVALRPLVRTGGMLVLTLDVTADDPEGTLAGHLVDTLADVWGTASKRRWRGLRLLDLGQDLAAEPAMETDIQHLVRTTPPRPEAPLAASIQLAYGDLGGETAAVYLPEVPLVTGLPIVDGEIPSLGDETAPMDLGAVRSADVVPLHAVTHDLEAPVREERSEETVLVGIGADVLFDSSSAELSGEAEAVLDDAAARILAHEPGPVTVRGHTDDVDTDEFNLDLSRRRADAVADALGARIDTSEYPLTTEGLGESEPIAPNTTAEGRALNRRVELRITTALKEEPAAAPEELPPFDGDVAPGADGLDTLPSGSRGAHLRVLAARMVEEHLVVSLEAVAEDAGAPGEGLTGYSFTPLLGSAFTSAFTDGGLAVLTGSTMTFPAWARSAESGDLLPLTDLNPGTRLDAAVPRLLELVFPRDIPGVAPGATIAMQYSTEYFRLVDITVEG